MRTCAYCKCLQRQTTEIVLRPATPEEIAEAARLRQEIVDLWDTDLPYTVKVDREERLKRRISSMASVCYYAGQDKLEDGAVTDGKMLLHRFIRKTGFLLTAMACSAGCGVRRLSLCLPTTTA